MSDWPEDRIKRLAAERDNLLRLVRDARNALRAAYSSVRPGIPLTLIQEMTITLDDSGYSN